MYGKTLRDQNGHHWWWQQVPSPCFPRVAGCVCVQGSVWACRAGSAWAVWLCPCRQPWLQPGDALQQHPARAPALQRAPDPHPPHRPQQRHWGGGAGGPHPVLQQRLHRADQGLCPQVHFKCSKLHSVLSLGKHSFFYWLCSEIPLN